MTQAPKDLLTRASLKHTPARVHVLKFFSDECGPINAEHIAKHIKDKSINLVTIYRTLKSFEEAGIIRRVNLNQDSVYYELAEHHHHHIICTGCGTLEEFETCHISPLTKSILTHSKKFKSITDHSLEVFGLCNKCSRA